MPDKVSVVITTNTLKLGGAERQRVTLANELVERGVDVELRVLQGEGPLIAELDGRVALGRPARTWAARRPSPRSTLITGTTRTEVGHAIVYRLLGLGRTNWLVAVHNPTAPGSRPFPRSVSLLMGLADCVVFLSKRQAGDLAGVRVRKSAIVPNGSSVPITNGSSDEGRATLNGPSTQESGHPRLLFVGRLVHQKGVDLFLEALLLVQDLSWHVVIVGEGPDYDLRRAARFESLADRVTWVGGVPSERYLPSADLLVMPSRNEAYPMVLLEAAIAGVPYVATEVGAVPEISDEACGVVVEPTVSAIAEGLETALRRLPELQETARALQEHSRTMFSSSLMAERYLRIIGELNV
jgi:glycosyltransferase involved in cell wall biosynthesis